MPPPDILPKAAWRDELVRMMLIREGAPVPEGASNFIPVPRDWLPVLRYYEANAPARLPDPEPWPAVEHEAAAPSNAVRMPPRGVGAIAVAHVRLLDLDGDKRLDIVASDMRAGAVLAGLARDGFAMRPIATLKHPAHIEPVDLDRDGLEDLLVADLGSFLPAEHQQGSRLVAPPFEGRHVPRRSRSRRAWPGPRMRAWRTSTATRTSTSSSASSAGGRPAT